MSDIPSVRVEKCQWCRMPQDDCVCDTYETLES